MSNLKQFFVEKELEIIPLVSLESLIEPLQAGLNSNLLHLELESLQPSLEALIDYGNMIDANDQSKVSNFQRVADSVLYPITGTMISTESLDISLEGLGSMLAKVKDFVSGRKKEILGKMAGREGKKYHEYDKEVAKTIAAVRSQLTKFHLNASWLDKQEFNTGEISGDGISNNVLVDGKLPEGFPADYIKHIDKFVGVCNGITSEVKQYGEKITALHSKICAVADKTNPDNDAELDKLAAVIKDVTAEFKRLPQPPKSTLLPLHVAGNWKLFTKDKAFVAERVKGDGPAKVAALDKDGVIACAKSILKALDVYSELYGQFYSIGTDHSDGAKLNEFIDSSHDVGAALDEWYDLTYHQTFYDCGYHKHEYIAEGQLEVAKSFDRWMERSIK